MLADCDKIYAMSGGFSTEGMRLVFLAALAGALLGAALLQYASDAESWLFWRRSLHELR